MIGAEKFTVYRPYTYFYSGVSGNNKSPVTTPPASGCCLRIEAVGTPGTVKIYGTYSGSVTTETITSFDSLKVGFSYNKWIALTRFDITGFTSATIYPASSSGDIIKLTTNSTFSMMGDTYNANENQFRGEYVEYGGKTWKSYKNLQYDDRYTLQMGDKITIDDLEYTVAQINSDKWGGRLAFLIVWR